METYIYPSQTVRSADLFFHYTKNGKRLWLLGTRADSKETAYYPGQGIPWPAGGHMRTKDKDQHVVDLSIRHTALRELQQEFGDAFAAHFTPEDLKNVPRYAAEDPFREYAAKKQAPDDPNVPDFYFHESDKFAVEIDPKWIGEIVLNPKAFSSYGSYTLGELTKLAEGMEEGKHREILERYITMITSFEAKLDAKDLLAEAIAKLPQGTNRTQYMDALALLS